MAIRRNGTGRGAGNGTGAGNGIGRGGHNRTEAERKTRHARLHPGTPVPARGTGRR